MSESASLFASRERVQHRIPHLWTRWQRWKSQLPLRELPFHFGVLMPTSPVKETSEDAAFFRPKIDWLLTHYPVLAAIAVVLLYVLGYFFFNGYLSGFGYSMDAMPQDHLAIVLRAFFLFVHLSIYTLNHSFGGLTTLLGGFAAFAAMAVLYGALKLSAYLLDGLVVRWKGLVLKHASAALARKTVAGKPPGKIDQAFAGGLANFAAIVIPAAFLWVLLAIFVVVVVGLVQRYGKHLAEEKIDQFVLCESRSPAQKHQGCVEADAGTQGKVVGEIVAGSSDLILIFDGHRAHLLKRSDDLKATVLVKPLR